MLFLSSRGFRCIAHDRRGHGRSSQPWNGNDMDTYANDLAELVESLDLQDAIHVGHSTGGGEVARYIGRHGTKRVAKAVFIGAITPLMLKTDANPGGTPIEAFDQDSRGCAGRPVAVLQRFECALLRCEPPRRESLTRSARLVLVTGNDVRTQRCVRLHQGVLGDRSYRKPEEVRCADFDYPWR
jgi:pimeloyl-ACP methyl ester carboxylesterase